VTAYPKNGEATDVNYPTVQLSGPVGIFLTLSKIIVRRIISPLLRRLIKKKELVLLHAISLRKERNQIMDIEFLKELRSF
jgi:hypothetical protein